MNLLFMANNGLPRNGLVALYDPYRDTYGRNIVAKEPTSLSDIPSNDNVFWDNGVVFGDNSVTRYAYVSAGAGLMGAVCYLSVDVQMDDKSQPNVGGSATDDINIVMASDAYSTAVSIVSLGDDVYRITRKYIAAGNARNFGVLKTASNSNKGFRVVGNWQVNLSTLYPYSPPAGLPQSLTDYTGHANNAQLGSTAGADTNDPAYSGQGLVFGTDDYCKSSSPVFDDMPQFTCITVFQCPTYNVYQEILNKGQKCVLTTTSWGALSYQEKFNGVTAEAISNGTLAPNKPHICAVSRISNNLYIKPSFFIDNIKQTSTGTWATTGTLDSNSADDLFIGNRLAANESLNGTIYLQAWYNHVLSDSEYMQAYAYLKRLMLSRGITI